MGRRARSAVPVRPAIAAIAVVAVAIGVARAAEACPFCGHGTAGGSALSTIVVLGGVLALLRWLTKRSQRPPGA